MAKVIEILGQYSIESLTLCSSKTWWTCSNREWEQFSCVIKSNSRNMFSILIAAIFTTGDTLFKSCNENMFHINTLQYYFVISLSLKNVFSHLVCLYAIYSYVKLKKRLQQLNYTSVFYEWSKMVKSSILKILCMFCWAL